MGATERWVFVRDDGAIILHEENDGWTYLRRGPEAVESVITLDEIKHNPRLLREARSEIARWNTTLTTSEAATLHSLIDSSIRLRTTVFPCEPHREDQIRYLLDMLWGKLLPAGMIDAAFIRLTKK